MTYRIGIAAALVVAGLFAGGCANGTEGERTLEQAARIEDAGQMIARGEQLVADGKATEARGQALAEQGNRIDGERLAGEGRARQKQGQGLIEEGRKLRERAKFSQ